MVNEPLPIGQRVVHRTDSKWSGVVIDKLTTFKADGTPGRALAVVLFDGQDDPRLMLAEVLIAA